VIVGWDDDNGVPVVTAEDPRQVVTIHDPRDQRRVLAALKMFRDDEAEADFAYLYLPGRVFVARRATRVRRRSCRSSMAGRGSGTRSLSGPLPAGFENVLPVVRFRNLDGKSEFEPHRSVLDRINRAVLRRDVVTSYQAYRQRGIKGNLPEKDEHGPGHQLRRGAGGGPGRVLAVAAGRGDLGVGSGRSDAAAGAHQERHPDPGGCVADAVGDVDAGRCGAVGGGRVALQREGLVFKVEDRIARADHGWAVVQSLMARFAGDEQRADVEAIQPIWAPIERYSLSEMGSAWAQFVGLPVETKLRLILRLNPTDIARVKSEMQADAFTRRWRRCRRRARRFARTPTYRRRLPRPDVAVSE
jgi:hypothetical protein